MTRPRRQATVIIDTQNVYGLTEAVLGQRAKPDPSGVALAMFDLGFDLDRLYIAIAEPESRDAEEAARRLERLVPQLARLENALRSVAPRCGPAHADVASASGRCGGAKTTLTGVRAKCTATSSRLLLDQLHGLHSSAMEDLREAARELEQAVDRLGSLSGGSVPGDLVASAVRVTAERQAALRLHDRLSVIGSYLYAASANTDYLDAVIAASHPPEILRGRFPIGRDGTKAGEKQVDTLCAVECLEATREAVSRGDARTVLVISDDDDITPALARAARIASGSSVSVAAAGSLSISNRWRRSGAPRPSWLHIEACTMCKIVGLDPPLVALRRQELAALALGDPVTFLPGPADRVVTANGLELRYEGPGLTGPTQLFAADLLWGRDGSRPLPKVRLSLTPGRSWGRVVQAVAESSATPAVRARELEVPVDDGTRVFPAHVSAPGWWSAGDRLVVVDASTSGGVSPRVVGASPSSPANIVEPVVAEVRSTRAPFATVTAPSGTWDVFASGIPLSVGDTVVIWPYERMRRGSGRYPPKAVLLSSPI